MVTKFLINFCSVILISSVSLADKSWERSSVKSVQTMLNALGYTAGPVDAAWGRKTASALSLYCEEYQRDCSGGEEQVVELLMTDSENAYLDVEMDISEAIWFENRIGYGAPKHRVDRYIGKTRRETVRLVINEIKQYEDTFDLPTWYYDMAPLGRILQLRQGQVCHTKFMKNSLKEAWLSSLYQSGAPQFDRLSVFWLDHFSVAYDAYEHPHAFGRHLHFVRDWKDKSFSELLYASLSDPSMIVYLNNDKSDRNTPNENLAREFFELFALGEGNYSEDDVREFAKLLTGRAFNLAGEKYQFMNERAKRPNAKIFGKRYNKAETFVQSLKQHPAYGNYIIQKFYNEYVALTDVQPKELRRFKRIFAKNNYNILALFEAIISSNEFWELSGQLTLVKSPLDLFAGTARTLNSTGNTPLDFRYWPRINSLMRTFSQDLFDPESIDGWPTGKDWVQGSALDRRSTELINLFLDEKSNFSNPINSHKAAGSWNMLNENRYREAELQKFFDSAKKNQVMIEDIIVETDRDFNPDSWFQIRLVFKDVRFNSEKYDHLSLNLNYCYDCPKNDRNHAQLYKEMIMDNFFSKAKYHGSDGDTVHIGFSIPVKIHKDRGLSRSEGAILKGLIRSASIFLDKRENLRFGTEITLMGHEGRNWLRGLLESSGKLVDVYDTDSPVRLFKFHKYPQPRFNCNYRIGREEKELDIHFDYERLKKNYIGVEYEILGNSISDDPKKEKFRNLLMKIWRDRPSKNEENMVRYLMANYENQEKSVSLEEVFSMVEYNLR